MADLIDRQQAIDTVNHAIDCGWDCDIIHELNELPSAQPETPCYLGSPCEYQNKDIKLSSAQPVAKDINVPAKDCISRQASLNGLRMDGMS